MGDPRETTEEVNTMGRMAFRDFRPEVDGCQSVSFDAAYLKRPARRVAAAALFRSAGFPGPADALAMPSGVC